MVTFAGESRRGSLEEGEIARAFRVRKRCGGASKGLWYRKLTNRQTGRRGYVPEDRPKGPRTREGSPRAANGEAYSSMRGKKCGVRRQDACDYPEVVCENSRRVSVRQATFRKACNILILDRSSYRKTSLRTFPSQSKVLSIA